MKSEAIQPHLLDLPEIFFSLPVKKLWGFACGIRKILNSQVLRRASLVKLSAVASLVKLFVVAPPVKLFAAAPLMKPSAAASPVKVICRCIST
ncbi:unnamed protein product [Brassica oleracea]|uniref:Uncharacterized protein n=1 Tax=Brassica oleracea TaxID=3712 RepID=A0A3P6B3J2_BRAOL|nr:unnamed protein product [Brassica oleracea]